VRSASMNVRAGPMPGCRGASRSSPGERCHSKKGGTRQVVCGQGCCRVPQTGSRDCPTRLDHDNVQPLQVILHNVVCGWRGQAALSGLLQVLERRRKSRVGYILAGARSRRETPAPDEPHDQRVPVRELARTIAVPPNGSPRRSALAGFQIVSRETMQTQPLSMKAIPSAHSCSQSIALA
jgi:hypothetical protein